MCKGGFACLVSAGVPHQAGTPPATQTLHSNSDTSTNSTEQGLRLQTMMGKSIYLIGPFLDKFHTKTTKSTSFPIAHGCPANRLADYCNCTAVFAFA
jgi:hypothetical protein